MEARAAMSAGISGPDRGAVSPWHTLAVADVLAALETSAEGLDAAEAARRLQVNGPNQLPAPPRPHPVLRFLAQFNNMLIWFLLAAAAAAGFLGHFVDAGVIVAVVVINAIVWWQAYEGVFERRGHYEMVEKAGLYWHFVDLVWVFVFTFFYLL